MLNSFEKFNSCKFGSLVMIPLVRKLSARGGARHRGIYSGHSRRRGEVGFAQPREIILHQPVKGSRLRLSRVECFRRKKEREEKRKKKGGRWKLLLDHGKRTGGNRRIDEAPSMYIHWKSRANLFLWRDPWLFESLDLLMSF